MSDHVDGDSDRAPDDWLEEKPDGRLMVRSERKKDLPSIVHVGLDGGETPSGLRMAWVPAPFRFCLVCGVEYSGRQTRDLGKLSTLGSGGRSSATDNRQDASLQFIARLATSSRWSCSTASVSLTDRQEEATGWLKGPPPSG